MWYLSSRRALNCCMVVVFIIYVLQIWVSGDCRAEAIRIFPENGMRNMIEKRVQDKEDNKGKRDLFHQNYLFNGPSFSFNGTRKGFEDTKRRVPSCPDPLHN